ncbi:MAG: hypothetical protein IT317_21050 [Anaerolineales bacterium]|nr:hypothetical protein [Anaerolineales bacterium]
MQHPMFGLFAFVVGVSIAGGFILWAAIAMGVADTGIAFFGVLLGSTVSVLTQIYKSESDSKQQLRLAALERRLETHQKAYSLWREMLFPKEVENETKYDATLRVVIKCQTWFDENCLYLSQEAQLAFRDAWQAAENHADLVRDHGPADQLRSETDRLKRAGDVIRAGVYLPPINTNTP